MQQRLEAFVVAVIGVKRNKPVGTGFLVTNDGLIVTAYHVVQRAIGSPSDIEVEDLTSLNVRFSFAGITSQVLFVKKLSNRSADIAVLRAEKLPDGMQVAILGPSRESPGNTFISSGYRQAQGGAVGTIAPLELEATHGQFPRLILKSDQIDRGMSGAPVLDCKTNRVIGIVTSTWYGDTSTGKDRETAYAITSETMKNICPILELIDPIIEEGAVGSFIPHILENLPPPKTYLFVGRETERERITRVIKSEVPSILVTGMGGIGKTSLALEIAYSFLNERKFDVIIWFTFETELPIDLNEILDDISDTLACEDFKKLPITQKRRAVLKVLRSYRTLIVVDALEKAKNDGIYSFLTSIPRSCQLLATSTIMSAFPADEVIILKPFQESESFDLIKAKSVNKKLAKATTNILAQIHEVTGGLPFALEWAVGQINTGRRTLESICGSLQGSKEEEIYNRLFADSYKMLSRYEKSVLWAFSFFEDECLKEALETVSGCTKNILDQTLEKLVEASIVYTNDEIEEAKVHYSIHPLLRNFIQSRLKTLHSNIYVKVQQKFIKYYATYASNRIFQAKGAVQGSYQEFEVELRNLNAALDKCYEIRDGSTFISLVIALSYFYYTHGHWSERIRRGYQGIEASKWIGDSKSEAWMLINEIGYVLIQREQYDEAQCLISSGIDIIDKKINKLTPVEQEKDITDQMGLHFIYAIGLRYLAIINTKYNKYETANDLFEKALNIFGRLNRTAISANVRTEMGELAARQGEYKIAEQYFDKSLEYHLEHREKKQWVNAWIAKAYNGLGDIAVEKRNSLKAEDLYKKALSSAEIVGNKEAIAYSKYRLSLIAEQSGNKAKALKLAAESLELYNKIGKGTIIESLENLINSLESNQNLSKELLT